MLDVLLDHSNAAVATAAHERIPELQARIQAVAGLAWPDDDAAFE